MVRAGGYMVALALALAACGATERVQTRNIYERQAELARDPGFAAKLAAAEDRMKQMAWLEGSWREELTVFARAGEAESLSVATVVFRRRGGVIADEALETMIGYDPFVGRWWSGGVALPAVASAGAYADWDGRRMVVALPVRILGETYHLRQTLTRTDENRFEVLNEQRMAGGRYSPVDRYRYVRISP